MGEPFRPSSRSDDGLADWFHQADAKHDGRLTLEEMQRDADRFFASLDVNHDGEIDPDEIKRYEEVIAPEIRTAGHFDLGPSDNGERRGGVNGRGRGSHRGGRHDGGDAEESGRSFAGSSAMDQHQGAARYGLLDLPEPVISADTDFDRGVSLAEFRAAAQERFLALDLDHKGYLTLPELQRIRPAPAPTPSPPDQPKAESDESSAPQIL